MTVTEGAPGYEATPTFIVVAAVLVFIAWTSVMLPGFAFPWSNNVFHVPIVLGYAASLEGPHDAFTRSLDNFVSGFWPLLRLFANEHNVLLVFFSAHLIGRLLFVAGVYGIVRHFGATRIVALALVGLASLAPIFKGLSIVGHTETLASYLSHTGFAVAMLPGAWWLMLRGRWTAAAAVIGVIFNVNAFLSIWSVVAATTALLVLRQTIPNFLCRLLSCALAYGVMAMPTVIWTLSTVMQTSKPIDFRSYLLEYYPFHTFVHVQWGAVARYFAYLAAGTLTVAVANRNLGGNARIMTVLFAMYVAVFLIVIPLPYHTVARIMLNLFPLRIDAVINVVLIAIVLAWAARALSQEQRDTLPLAIVLSLLVGNMVASLLLLRHWCVREGWLGFASAIVAVLAASLLTLVAMGQAPSFGDEFAPLAFLFAGLALIATGRGLIVPLVAAAFDCTFLSGPGYPWPVVGLALAIAVAFAVPRFGWLAGLVSATFTCLWLVNGGDHLALLAAGALTVVAAVLLLPRLPALCWLEAFAVAPTGLLTGVVAIGLALSAYAGWRGSLERPDANLQPVRVAQLWARQNLPPGTYYLPVGVTGFSTLSRRPAWVDENWGAAIMWRPDFQFEWRPRMRELKACNDTACYAALARRHDVHWIVALPGRITNPAAAGLRARFANARFEIFSVGRAAGTGAS